MEVSVSDHQPAGVLTLTEALIEIASPETWDRYCRLAAELEGRPAVEPQFAPGSVEWRRQQDRFANSTGQPLPASAKDAGRRRLARRGTPLPFTGAPPPFGGVGSGAFDAFLARRRGSQALLSQIDDLEEKLIRDFELAGRSGRYRSIGFQGGNEKEVMPDWFGRVRFDFARNVVVLPDGSEIGGIGVTIGPRSRETDGLAGAGHSSETASLGSGGKRRERPSQIMLRSALIALWERGAFSASTGNERVLALAIRELGLSAADPPYGFKSAETVRKLRKSLNMSM